MNALIPIKAKETCSCRWQKDKLHIRIFYSDMPNILSRDTLAGSYEATLMH